MKSSLIKSTVIFLGLFFLYFPILVLIFYSFNENKRVMVWKGFSLRWYNELFNNCLLYTSPSPRDRTRSRMPSSA